MSDFYMVIFLASAVQDRLTGIHIGGYAHLYKSETRKTHIFIIMKIPLLNTHSTQAAYYVKKALSTITVINERYDKWQKEDIFPVTP